MKTLNIFAPSIFSALFIFSIESCKFTPEDIHKWSLLDVKFPNDDWRKQMSQAGSFDREKMIPYGFEVWNDKIFISLDMSGKVPIRLGYLNLKDSNGTVSPQLIPYPDWDTNQDWIAKWALPIVTKMYVDKCDRLWLAIQGFGEKYAQFKFVVYNLKTNEAIKSLEVEQYGGLSNFVVDVTKVSCDRTFVYITYFSGELVVYDFEKNKAWKNSNLNLTLSLKQGQKYYRSCESWTFDTVKYMEFATLLSPGTDGDRRLYFRIFPGNGGFYISSKGLRNETVSQHEYGFLDCRSNFPRISYSVFDERTGILFQNTNAIISCWNATSNPNKFFYDTAGFCEMHDDVRNIDFDREIKVDGSGNGSILILSTRKDPFRSTNLTKIDVPSNETKINFKLSIAPIHKVIKGTVCKTG